MEYPRVGGGGGGEGDQVSAWHLLSDLKFSILLFVVKKAVSHLHTNSHLILRYFLPLVFLQTYMLIPYWFDGFYKGKPFSCAYKMPPNAVQRIPSSLLERKRYKASEYRTWLLFYVLPVMDIITGKTGV